MMDNEPDEALKELRIAVSLIPDPDVANHLLERVLFQQGDLEGADRGLQEALRVNLWPTLTNRWPLALMSLDRDQVALAEIDVAAKLDPECPLYRESW